MAECNSHSLPPPEELSSQQLGNADSQHTAGRIMGERITENGRWLSVFLGDLYKEIGMEIFVPWIRYFSIFILDKMLTSFI